MKTKSNRFLKTITIILPVIIVVGAAALFLQNYFYNTRERIYSFSDAERDGTSFVFDDIIIDIAARGGDAGSWSSDELWDDNKKFVYKSAVGTIYDMTIINNTTNVLHDWNVVVYIPEDMYVNNTWNGDFEYHQNVKSGNEDVQQLKLSNYSQYDITLECYPTFIGPMLKLYEGDFFIYHPNPELEETTITGRKSPTVAGNVKIGFIMYVPERPMDYVADFSMGEIHYHLQASITKNPFFRILGVMTVIWVSCFISLITVKINLKRFVEQQKRDQKIIEQTMQTFVNFIEAKDPSTMGHSLRVAQYSRMIAEKLGFSETECYHVYYIALMHDCGKIYIPDEILSKPGKLTNEEYEIMKKHTVYGSEILRDFTAIEGMGTGALSHHERYDGKGYPNGVAGEDIPIIGRIICVSDAFDAMNSRRCYRSNLSEEVILNELQTNRGTQFDPNVIDCLMSLIESGAISMSGHNSD